MIAENDCDRLLYNIIEPLFMYLYMTVIILFLELSLFSRIRWAGKLRATDRKGESESPERTKIKIAVHAFSLNFSTITQITRDSSEAAASSEFCLRFLSSLVALCFSYF